MAKAAMTDEKITAVDGINEDNVDTGDRAKLREAKEAIEAALEEFGKNYTDAEKNELNEKLGHIDALLDIIEEFEQKAEKIGEGLIKASGPFIHMWLIIVLLVPGVI